MRGFSHRTSRAICAGVLAGLDFRLRLKFSQSRSWAAATPASGKHIAAARTVAAAAVILSRIAQLGVMDAGYEPPKLPGG
jgi:predicted alpha-1,6-mannanase (GH76 family)